MRRFEAELERLVLAFVEQLADLARLAARDMVIEALGAADRRRKRDPQRSILDRAAASPLVFRSGLTRAVDDFERRCIVRALAKHGGSITHAAVALRTTRQSLQRKIQRLGISKQAPRR